MKTLKLKKVEVSLVLVSDRVIARLNHRYRNKNRVTDVLSFSQEPAPSSGIRHLGDIVISLSRARKQAKEAGHSILNECSILSIHGLLHLLGHDHEKPAEARAMFRLQDRLVARIASDV